MWLSPFYPSALADGGYDVDDYRNVDPKIGTLDEFDEMVAALHAAHIKVVVDIVPNHSSNRHKWFRAALNSPKGSNERSRYIFRDGKGENGELPPNEWQSNFGGGAWQRITEPDGSPGQWYLHLFAKEQPDFNWDHPDVHEDFLETLRFWSDRGVDGFRVDVAHGLKKNLDPAFDALADVLGGRELFVDGQHPVWDRDEVHEIYKEWRDVFNEYEPPRTAVAEAWVAPHRQARYASPEGLGQTFNFDLLQADFRADEFHEIISRNLTAAEAIGGSTTWVLSNHDVVRHATRYGLPGGQESKGAPGAGRPPAPAMTESCGFSTAGIPHTSIMPRVPDALARRRCFFSGCPARPTCIRARNWVCRRWARFPTRTDRIRPSSATGMSRSAVMAAAFRCRGAAGAGRSDSATTALTCRSRTGSATTPSRFRMKTPPQP
nr:alpha-amylase family glycosyl hydrolase [Corynebacterium xerosis]